jgi:signal transduction histidine kinase
MNPTPETCLTQESLECLMEHRATFEAETSVGAVFDRIGHDDEEFHGVVEAGRYAGLVSKAQLALLLSGRFGYALYARQPIGQHLLQETVTVTPGDRLLDALDRALTRTGPAFHHDLAAVAEDGSFLGILPMPTLARLQNELIAEQVRRAEDHKHALEAQELQLFRSQQRLRQSEGRFGIVFEKGPLGFALLDPEGRIELCNGRLAEMLELPAAITLPPFAACLAPRQREAFDRLVRSFDHGSDSAHVRSLELRFERPGAEARIARCDLHWVKETAQICVCVQDITTQRRLEQRMQQKEKSALLDSLAGGIAHELNNKLLPVLGFADLLSMRAGPNSELSRSCEIIQQSALEASELVSQLLQLSRPPALEPRACDLVGIVQAAVGILRFRFREAGCEPRLQLPSRTVPLRADPAQLKQVLVNLCLNALDAMRGSARRQLEIALSFEEDGACLRIRDSGEGIAGENLARIFDPFFTTKSVQQGTGLGLSVCFSIVQQHAGTIEVESTGPEGTVFALWLPLENGLRLTPEETLPRENIEPCGSGLGRSVLVVDDEEFITTLLHEALRTSLGCRVTRASSAEEAIDRVAAQDFDLVISDVRLPGQNGIHFFNELTRTQPELAERFIFITGDPGSRELNTVLSVTNRPVLRKPFGIDNLIAEARNQLATPLLRMVPAA